MQCKELAALTFDVERRIFWANHSPNLNHLLQHAESGTPAEFGAIEETISPEVLQLISVWAAKHGGT